MIYSDHIETLFKNSASQIEAMAELNRLAHISYLRKASVLNIPIIALSLGVGFLSQIEGFQHQNILLGLISLLVSFLKSLESYYDIVKKCETFRMLNLQYRKLFNVINIELNKLRSDRMDCVDLLNLLMNEIEQMEKQQPYISEEIVKKFNKKFGTNYTNGQRPPVLNGLTEIHINKNEVTNIEIQTDEISQIRAATPARPWRS